MSTRDSNHLRQGRLGNVRYRAGWLFVFSIASEREKRSSQSLLSRTAKLVDQIFLDLNVACD